MNDGHDKHVQIRRRYYRVRRVFEPEPRSAASAPIYVEGSKDNIQVEVALQYNDGYSENIYSFANNINTHEGGTHESGFKSALTRIINEYARKMNAIKDNDSNLSGDDVREGLTAIISVKIPEPQFEGQTKTKLGNSEVRGIVESFFAEKFQEFLDENPGVAKQDHRKRTSGFPCSRSRP